MAERNGGRAEFLPRWKEVELRLIMLAKWYCQNRQRGTSRGKVQWEDLLQQTCLELLQSYPTFDSTRASFSTWAGHVMARTAYRMFKKQASYREADALDENDWIDSSEKAVARAFQVVSATDFEEVLQHCFAKLKGATRELAILRLRDGMTLSDVVQVSGQTLATVRRLLDNANNLLSACLSQNGIEPL
ncbi:MAG: sigma-70 family RNA polymerase sigma factor [Planctomycetes bacterium]|nr:sigma-70 family RNA polymerase sigma factor [Planctomycetota bacterium]